ncbi:MAG: hypothetical protein IH897_11680 [Planctomycetes bacterium]|nr:hypothetical protein [Planctomycetota bacterium]
MNEKDQPWTTRDLELFHDDELDDRKLDAMSDALRRDPALRDRLVSVRNVDDQLREFLLDPASSGEDRRASWSVSASWSAAAAACVLVSVSLLWYVTGDGSPNGAPVVVQGDATPVETLTKQVEPSTNKSAYQPIRVVFTLPARTKQDEETVESVRPPEPPIEAHDPTLLPPDNRPFLASLNRALAGGHVSQTVRLLRDAPSEQRTEAYRFLGELLRSAEVAEQILDRLPPREQLAVCKVWAHEPGRRPVAFDRLHRLSSDPELSGAVRTVIADLHQDPSLKKLLRSYRFAEPDKKHSQTSS